MFFVVVCFFFQQKNVASNIVANARMKFASEARPSQYIVPFGNTEPTCMPLSGHFIGPSVPDGEIPTQSNL